jgi:hypothetical protein
MYFLKVLGANNDEELFSQKFLLQRWEIILHIKQWVALPITYR